MCPGGLWTEFFRLPTLLLGSRDHRNDESHWETGRVGHWHPPQYALGWRTATLKYCQLLTDSARCDRRKLRVRFVGMERDVAVCSWLCQETPWERSREAYQGSDCIERQVAAQHYQSTKIKLSSLPFTASPRDLQEFPGKLLLLLYRRLYIIWLLTTACVSIVGAAFLLIDEWTHPDRADDFRWRPPSCLGLQIEGWVRRWLSAHGRYQRSLCRVLRWTDWEALRGLATRQVHSLYQAARPYILYAVHHHPHQKANWTAKAKGKEMLQPIRWEESSLEKRIRSCWFALQDWSEENGGCNCQKQ